MSVSQYAAISGFGFRVSSLGSASPCGDPSRPCACRESTKGWVLLRILYGVF